MPPTSIGIALFPQDGPDPDTLLKHAELALYRAKALGRNQFRFFEAAMDEAAQARRRLERELRLGLERGEFVLHYQPQLELASGRLAGVEALIRWNHPERGLVLPGAFIPAAEANGLIRPLGAWVLREACRQAKAWRERGWDLSVAVNLSPAQLRHSQFLPTIGDALEAAGLEPARLELEITEGVLMENFEQQGDSFLRGLTADGVRLALDDFGIGYSSLAYLKHLPVKTIKIDRSFVRDLGQDPDALALVRAIVTLGHSLRKRVVAEGVENAIQLDLLRELGCDEAQGFHIARPLDTEQLENSARYTRQPGSTLRRSDAGKRCLIAGLAKITSNRTKSQRHNHWTNILYILNRNNITQRFGTPSSIGTPDYTVAHAGPACETIAHGAAARQAAPGAAPAQGGAEGAIHHHLRPVAGRGRPIRRPGGTGARHPYRPDQLTELVRRADLARVKGVGTVFGRMLEDLGIGDVAKLAHQKPGRLHERLRRHNAASQLARRSPTADEVADWIAQARRLPILVTYQPRDQEAAS